MENETLTNAVQTNDAEIVNTGAQGAGASYAGQAENPAAAEKSDGAQQNNSAVPEEKAEKPKQDSQTNAEFAKIRRAHKKQLEEERRQGDAREKKARNAAIIEHIGTNPYTQKPILDDDDVEEYLVMRQISKDGKDPVADYPAYIKAQKQQPKVEGQGRHQENNVAKEIEEFKKVYKDVELEALFKDESFEAYARLRVGKDDLSEIYESYKSFSQSYPEVSIKDLLSDENFKAFAEGKNKELGEIYESYLPFKRALDGQKESIEKQAHSLANKKAAVGSLTNSNGSNDSEFYTKEQVRAMSGAEVKKNYDKIRASMAKW